MREVRKERTGWRHEEISARHRDWGWDVPVTDLDWIVSEYDNKKTVALVEYKHEKSRDEARGKCQMPCLVDLGNRAGVPVFLVIYSGDMKSYTVYPCNEMAQSFASPAQHMTELEYVTMMYRVRGRDLPSEIADKLGDVWV